MATTEPAPPVDAPGAPFPTDEGAAIAPAEDTGYKAVLSNPHFLFIWAAQVLSQTAQVRAILVVVDGQPPLGVEEETDVGER